MGRAQVKQVPSFTCTSTVHARMHTCMHTHAHACAYTHTCASLCMHMYAHTHAHAWTCAHTSMPTRPRAAQRGKRPLHRLALCLLIKCCPPCITSIGDYLLGFSNLANVTVVYGILCYVPYVQFYEKYLIDATYKIP